MSASLAGDAPASCAVILAHGAGNGMDAPFLRAFQSGLAERGFLAVLFNFSYMEAGRRLPDPRPRLEACYQAVADFVRARFPSRKLIVGGKSMGGRIASHLVAGGYPADALLFLGYPLHPPGKPEQLRDQHLYGIPRPMLFLSGTRDSFATPDLLASVVARIGPHATLHWIPGADHSLKVRGRPQNEVYAEALDVITGWAATAV